MAVPLVYFAAVSLLAIRGASAGRSGGSGGGTGASSGSSYCYNDSGQVVECPNPGLSTGAIVGTVIGVVAFLVIIVAILIFIRRRGKAAVAPASEPPVYTSPPVGDAHNGPSSEKPPTYGYSAPSGPPPTKQPPPTVLPPV